MTAVAKTLAKIDDLRTPEQQNNFLKQFQFTSEDIDRMLGDKTLGEQYMLSAEDEKDLKNNFQKLGRQAFKRKCKFTEDEMIELVRSKKRNTDDFQKTYTYTCNRLSECVHGYKELEMQSVHFWSNAVNA